MRKVLTKEEKEERKRQREVEAIELEERLPGITMVRRKGNQDFVGLYIETGQSILEIRKRGEWLKAYDNPYVETDYINLSNDIEGLGRLIRVLTTRYNVLVEELNQEAAAVPALTIAAKIKEGAA